MARKPRLAGNVRERGNSRSLVVRFQGVEYSQVVHTRTLTEAKRMLPAFVASVVNGERARARETARALAEAPTVREAVEYHLVNHMRMDADGEGTRHFYRYALGLLAGQIGDRRIGDITAQEMQRVLRDLHQSGRARREGGLAISSMKPIHAVISRFFSQLVEDKAIPVNPVPKFAKLNLGRVIPARRKHMTRDEVSALLAECADDPSLHLWVRAMLATGCRPGETLGLRWSDVANGVVSVNGSVKAVVGGGYGRIGSTKTATSVRSIPLGSGLAAALTEERARQEGLLRQITGTPDNLELLQPLVAGSDCIFCADIANQRDVPMSMGAMRGRFERAARRAGLSGITAHSGRHTAITAMVAGTANHPGIGIADAARLAGHSNPMTTARTYAHALPENLHRGIALADDMIAPSSGRASGRPAGTKRKSAQT